MHEADLRGGGTGGVTAVTTRTLRARHVSSCLAGASICPVIVAPRPKIWARSDYERIVEVGILGPGDRVELLEGEIVEISPEKSRHAAAVDLALEALRRVFGAGHTIRVQHPLALSDDSEPEPDIAVVVGSPRDYA